MTQLLPKAGQAAKSDVLIWAFVFLGVQACIRLLLSPSLQADEAEIVLSSQVLSLGYDDHPPLYAWLYWLSSSIFGVNLFSLVLLKYSLLGFTVYQIHRLASELGDVRTAGISVLSLLLFWQIMPKMQIDYTHSVLLLAMTAWYLRQLFRLLKSGRRQDYLLFACVSGFALLSKPNFLPILLATLAAVSLNPEYRRVLSPVRVAGLLLIVVLISSPYLLWLYQLEMQSTATAPASAASGFSLVAGFRSLAAFVIASLASFTPFLVVGLLLLKKSRPDLTPLAFWAAHRPASADTALLRRTFLLGLLLLALFVFLSNTSEVKERYLLPLDLLLPITFALYFRECLDDRAYRLLIRISQVLALLLLVFNLNEIIRPYTSGKADSLNLPYRDLRAQIVNRGFSDGDNILVPSHLYGGNLRRLFPQSRVITRWKAFVQPDPNRRTLLIWAAERYGKRYWDKPGIPPEVLDLVARYLDPAGINPKRIELVTAPYYYFPEKRFKMGMLILPARE